MTHSLKATPKPYVQSSLCPYVREDNSALEFSSVLPYMKGLCLDIGSGGNRFSDTVLAIDSNPTADCDMVWDVAQGLFVGREGEFIVNPYPFKDGTFDAVFASHVIEDFPPNEIQAVFNEWMRLIKPKGYLCLLVPDMEGKRYPDVDDKWTWDDELVQKGERNPGDCRGNSSHRITMGVKCLFKLTENYPGALSVVQYDTLPKDQMTLDFIIQKL